MNPKEPLVDVSEPAELPASDLDSVTAERDRLLEEKNDLLDRLLRLQAEFDNFRRRANREKAEVIEYGNSERVGAIVPILDDFENALKLGHPDSSYTRGMELIDQPRE